MLVLGSTIRVKLAWGVVTFVCDDDDENMNDDSRGVQWRERDQVLMLVQLRETGSEMMVFWLWIDFADDIEVNTIISVVVVVFDGSDDDGLVFVSWVLKKISFVLKMSFVL